MDIKQTTPVVVTRKAARELIENALQNVQELQNLWGDKKFKRRVKKAGKFITEGLPKTASQKKPKLKNTIENAS